MLVIGPHGRALRGDASIAPYIPFTDGTVGRGLDPSYAVCNDGNIYHLLHNKKSYVGGGVPDAPDEVCVAAHGGVKTPPCEPMENERQYPNGQPRTPAGRRGRRPLRMFFDKQLKGRGDTASSLRADDEHRPLQYGCRGILAPKGSIGEERKSVKKNAALLRFLAFLLLDHLFEVPRGE